MPTPVPAPVFVPTFTPGQMLPECRIEITQALIDRYAELSGDFNPIHVDPAAGAAQSFGGTIAHGCIPMEPVFQSILLWSGADRLPPGTRIRLRYRAPSQPGDVIRSQVRIGSGEHADAAPAPAQAGIIPMTFTCLNQNGQLVIDGDCEFRATTAHERR